MISMREKDSGRVERGDTIIEVLLAIAILGALIAVSYGVMVRGYATGQNSLDRTNTQALMNGQANMLRAAHSRYINAATESDKQYWNTIKTSFVTASDVTTLAAEKQDGCKTAAASDKLFYFNIDNPDSPGVVGALQPQKLIPVATPTPDLVRKVTYPKVGDGLWIEAYQQDKNGAMTLPLYTFYIKSCSRPAYDDGSEALRSNVVIVRFYAE